jgi:hypothetical protein
MGDYGKRMGRVGCPDVLDCNQKENMKTIQELTTEVVALIEQTKDLPDDGCDPLVTSMREVILYQAAEIMRLQADAERLDWLEAHQLPTEIMGGKDDGLESKAWAIACDQKWSLREAIDITREAAPAAERGES